MAKAKIFRVINDRIQFICSHCGKRKNMHVPPQLRRKNIRCPQCREATSCQFNRRLKHREQRSGKIILITASGEELMVNLQDISEEGLGIDIPPGFSITSKVKIRSIVRIKCNWNPQLTDVVEYEVKNIIARRVGLQKRMLKYMG